MRCAAAPFPFPDTGAANDAAERLPRRLATDPWCNAVATLMQPPRPMAAWPAGQGQVVRLLDDEVADPERDARVAELFRTLPDDVSEADRRILFALAHSGPLSQRALARELDMDRAYLSRRLRRLDGLRLVARGPRGWSVCRIG